MKNIIGKTMFIGKEPPGSGFASHATHVMTGKTITAIRPPSMIGA